jgi:hypothetical protein
MAPLICQRCGEATASDQRTADSRSRSLLLCRPCVPRFARSLLAYVDQVRGAQTAPAPAKGVITSRVTRPLWRESSGTSAGRTKGRQMSEHGFQEPAPVERPLLRRVAARSFAQH